jgi:hypothetical protein
MTVYINPVTTLAQQAAFVKLSLRAGDPSTMLPALATAGFSSVSINSDGSVFNKATGLFLTDAQLATLLPALPHNWGATV